MAKRKPVRRQSRRKNSKGKPFRRRFLWISALVGAVAFAVLVGVLDWVVRHKFEGSKWSLPAHVYARPLELYQGSSLRRDQLTRELGLLGYRSVPRVSAPGQYRIVGSGLEIYTRAFHFWDGSERAKSIRVTFNGQGISRLSDRSGALTLVRLDPLLMGGIYPDHLEDRVLVRLEDLPPYLADGLIAVEDRDFDRHHGISFKGIARAMVSNIKAGAFTQGGSTLTQQLVKNFYLTQERSLLRKGLEAIMAVLLEVHYNKADILEAYINEVYLGQAGRRSIHGFGLASQHYFRQPLDELELHQVALLVGLVKGASYYDPWRNPERAKGRRDLIIDVMRGQGLVDATQAGTAKRRGLDIARRPGTSINPFPDYLDLVKRQLREDYREEDLSTAGLRVFTNFDPQVQYQVEQSINHRLAGFEQAYKLDKNSLQAASVVVRVGTGDVLAIAGGRRSGYAGFNRALDARRPVGSTLKPAVYLTALQHPERYTLATLLNDEPLSVPLDNGDLWQPRNFERKSHGQVPLYEALGKSYNQATARIGLDIGLPQVIDTLQRLGYQESLRPLPAVLLGAVNMSPMDVAGIYHSIAADGFYTPLRSIQAVYDANNQPLKRYPFQAEQRFPPQTMHLLQYGLQVVVREGTGKGAYNHLPSSLVVAGKTGTTNGQRDSWFAGFSGNYLSVVWLGRDDNGKMPLTGGTGALRVWADTMAGLDNQSLPFMRPEGVNYTWVESYTGKLSSEGCIGARYMPFIAGSEPKEAAACYRAPGSPVLDWFERLLGRWE